jgi:hypothetical protein
MASLFKKNVLTKKSFFIIEVANKGDNQLSVLNLNRILR